MSELAAIESIETTETKVVRLFDGRKPLALEYGSSLPIVDVAYETHGELNGTGTNAVLICHALTANAHAAGIDERDQPGWWDSLIGPGKAIDTDRYFVVCPNILGSCYGTTGPTSLDPTSGNSYRANFPRITVRDIVRVQHALIELLGIKSLSAVIGSSLGGMQVLEWALMYPGIVERIVPISTGAQQSAWCIALNAIARGAIVGDAAWKKGEYQSQPAHGLALARMVGMCSYRSYDEFNERFGRETNPSANEFQIESYLRHQGDKLVERFDANTYLTLSHATDSHDIARGRGTVEETLRSIRAETLAVGVSSDSRYPKHEQQFLAENIPGAKYDEVRSIHGHDAFLIEFDQLTHFIATFLNGKRS